MRLKSIIIVCAALLLPTASWAAVPDVFREYVTYGNFNVTVTAFEKLSLLMSSPSFNTFAIIAILASAMIWGAGGFFSMIRSRRLEDWFQGIIIILIGAVVYAFFIMPKSDLLVHDEPSNRSMVVSEVPDGLILLAGMQNQFVLAAVNMIWTSSDPESYRQNARGDIFDILQNVFENKSFMPSLDDSTGKNLGLSIERYFKDCVLFEIARPGSNINANDFFANTSILSVMAEANSLSVPTVYYDNTYPSGFECSCNESYTNIEQSLANMAENSGTNEKFWTERCGKAGYYDYQGADGEPAQVICRNKAVDFLALYVTLQDSVNLMRQYLVSSQIFNYIKTNDIQALSDFKIMTATRGEATASLKWLPILKGAIFSVYLGLTPFLFILIPTLVFPRVLQFILGIFAFMISWEICDALLHSYAMDMSIASFRELFNGGLSLKSLWMMEGESQHALMIFGKMRWASMILASTVSVVLARFGGLAIAHVASMLNVGAYGPSAANDILNPEQRSEELKRLPNTAPVEAITNEHSWSQLQGQGYYNLKSRVLGDQMIITGHSGPGSAARVAGQISDFGFSDQEQRMDAVKDTAANNSTSVGDALYKPHRSAAETGYARADVDSKDNWDLAGTTASVGRLGEQAGYIKNRIMDDIKRDGEISPYTASKLETLNGIAEGRMAFLNAPPVSSNLNDAEKANMSKWLNENGYPVGSLGSQATANFALDSAGNVIPSGISTFEGHRGTSGFSTSETHGHSMEVAITPARRLVINNNGEQLEFIGGRLTGFEGGYHDIQNGLTSDGQLINGTIGPDGRLIKTSHPSPLEVPTSTMLNLLSSNSLPKSHINVQDNQGAAVQSWVGAMRTYAQRQGIDNSAWNWAVSGYAEGHVGTPLGGIAGSGVSGGITGTGGHSWQFSENETNNMLATEISQRISEASSNQEKLEVMQESFNEIMDGINNPNSMLDSIKEKYGDLEGRVKDLDD
jgi:conjugal transfer mating pair stabilization protein TraG